MESAPFDPRWLNTVDQLYHYEWSVGKLLRIRLLERSIASFWPNGHPTRIVHVAGSNGKGSTCRMLEAALGTLGPSGCWVNPHLFDYVERFRVRGEPADKLALARIWQETVLPHSLDREESGAGRGLSFAEAGILLALHLFQQEGLRWAAFETGVGGRYAPTMALDPELCLLTNVGHDHPRTLGSQAWQVALEKAGIARRGRPLLSTATGASADFVRRTAESQGAECVILGKREREEVRDLLPPDARAHRGEHWLGNASLALAAARLLEPTLDAGLAVRAMQSAAPLEGRFWLVDTDLLADVAHNRDKVGALAEDLRREYPGRPIHLLAGLSRQRAAMEVLGPLLPLVGRITLTNASYAGRDPELLRDELRAGGVNCPLDVQPDPVLALAEARARLEPGALLVLTGSAYTVDQALNPDPFHRTMNREFGRRGAADPGM